MTLDFPANPTDGQLYPASPATPLWEFTAGKGWKRLGGGGLVLPSEEEARDGVTNTPRSWSSLRARQATVAWYLTQAPVVFGDFGPEQRPLSYYLPIIDALQAPAFFPIGKAPSTVAAGNDSRFGSQAFALNVSGNAVTLFPSSAEARSISRLEINSTAAFTLNVSEMPPSPDWWEARIIIKTTQVPASFTFAGGATKRDVAGSTLADNPFAAGKVTVLDLCKVTDSDYTAEFKPAVTIT